MKKQKQTPPMIPSFKRVDTNNFISGRELVENLIAAHGRGLKSVEHENNTIIFIDEVKSDEQWIINIEIKDNGCY